MMGSGGTAPCVGSEVVRDAALLIRRDDAKAVRCDHEADIDDSVRVPVADERFER
jgi:hypothetical protein